MTNAHAPRVAASNRRRLFTTVAALALAVVFTGASRVHAQAADFNVTSNGAAAYTINGADNPTLNLLRGHTYSFAVNTPGHPFYIKTAQVTGTGSAYNVDVTNNGVQTGTLVFTVPSGAPSTLFYQCSVHSAMTGTLAITGTVLAPAMQPWAWLLLFAGLLGLGVIAMRKNAGLPANRGTLQP
jgi:hypothetical protein